jgi:hypothetical protein
VFLAPSRASSAGIDAAHKALKWGLQVTASSRHLLGLGAIIARHDIPSNRMLRSLS